MNRIIFLFLISCGSFLQGQSLITLLHNGQSSFYPVSRLDSAYAHAVSGDSLLLPGDVVSLPVNGWEIMKPIHVIGVGHQPDSTGGTRTTVLAGEVFVLESASGGSIQSVHITNTTRFGVSGNSTGEELKDFLFWRCFFGGIFYMGYNTNNDYIGNNEFRECIFGDRTFNPSYPSTPCVQGQETKGNRFFNCIFDRSLTQFGEGTLFDHCLFLGYGGQLNNDFWGCYFQNNIFLGFQTGNYPTSVSNNVFFHNLFDTPFNPPFRNIEGFNYENVSQTGLFVNKSFQHLPSIGRLSSDAILPHIQGQTARPSASTAGIPVSRALPHLPFQKSSPNPCNPLQTVWAGCL